MKFREFVGEEKAKKVKEIVSTNIGDTDVEHLKTVLRETLDGTKIEYRELGFNLSKKNLKRVFDYIKSWFIRYKVEYKPINPYITLYLLSNVKSSQKVIKRLRDTKGGIIYKPKGTLTVISANKKFPLVYGIPPVRKRDYIVLDYLKNETYGKVMDDMFHNMGINIKREYYFVKLFEIESDKFNHEMYEDMMYSIPEIPEVKLGNAYLLRR